MKKDINYEVEYEKLKMAVKIIHTYCCGDPNCNGRVLSIKYMAKDALDNLNTGINE